MAQPNFPIHLRRARLSPLVRDSFQQVELGLKHLMQPLFVVEGISRPEAIPGLTGTLRDTPESLLKQVESDLTQGIHKFLLFGVPAKKSSANFRFDFTANQILELKKRFGRDLLLFADVCLCSSTESGQCGILGEHTLSCPGTPKIEMKTTQLLNSPTVEVLVQQALQYEAAGVDGVAPSDMMDGRIGAIRQALKLESTLIMSYSAKFHSKFYGPFRVAADSAPKGGAGSLSLKDRSTYQIDPSTPRDAYLSSMRDLQEGADFLMVKPGMPYLDVLKDLSTQIPDRPWVVYQVSGEFAALELLAEQGLIDRMGAHREAWIAFRRAGASLIISYGARFAKEWLSKE